MNSQSLNGDPAAARPRVLLADDHAWMLEEMETLISSDFEVVGKVRDGVSLLEAASRLQPDLIVTDLAMPVLTGLEASRAALRAQPNVPIVLVTMHTDKALVQDALDAGVLGYVHKLTAGEELIPAMLCALQRKTFVSAAFLENAGPSTTSGVHHKN
jgi:DNA-binding NarL/FixJ family response regulator